ncbi:MAG: hypothetical protein KA807_09010 [Prolixibacteraceae bacterium]|nr:hypothetical protein [Prolixibacteraceae bacterium]
MIHNNEKTMTLQYVAMSFLFPGLFFMISLAENTWLCSLSQIIGWINIIMATIVVLTTYRNQILLFALLGLFVLLKMFNILYNNELLVQYIIVQNLLYCLAGAAIVYRNRISMIYKQLLIICLINLVFMTMQVLGVGEWINFLATHAGAETKVPESVFFAIPGEFIYRLYQGRPAGLTSSNLYVSLLIVFGFAFHLAYERSSKLMAFIISSMVVLAMSKQVFLNILILFMLSCIIGTRRKTKIILLLLIVIFSLYAMLLPGLLYENLSLETVQRSIFLRLKSFFPFISDMLDNLAVFHSIKSYTNKFILSEVSETSGYTVFLKMGNIFLFLYFFLILLFIIRVRIIHVNNLFLQRLIYFGLVNLLLFPLSQNTWALTLFWFINGFVFFPVFRILQPNMGEFRNPGNAKLNYHLVTE